MQKLIAVQRILAHNNANNVVPLEKQFISTIKILKIISNIRFTRPIRY